jgi:hypothetical protein
MQNNVPIYLKLPKNRWFDFTFLMSILEEYHSPRDKISSMLAKGVIIRIRKGLYIRSSRYEGDVMPIDLANIIYGPSYISLETALLHYGLIPEQVKAVTSVTSKRKKKYSTPVGNFIYNHIPQKAFSTGIILEQSRSVSKLIACKEKALCDKIAITSGIRTLNDLGNFILHDQRIDIEGIKTFSEEVLIQISEVYCLNSIRLFLQWYRKIRG